MVAIAASVGMPVKTLTSRIQRAGGASIRQFRRQIILVRLAAIVEDPGVPWSQLAELLGVPRTHTLITLVRSCTNLPAGLWRERIRGEWQFQRFRAFLRIASC